MSGTLIAFEGGEGCGKSTQAARLAKRLGAVLTREPGGTDLGVRLRELLLDPATGALSARAEALLMLADRAHHVDTVIRPALAAGAVVVTDRFSASTLAYQGAGRGLDEADLAAMSRWASAGIEPQLTVLLDVPDDVAAARLGTTLDRFEGEGDGFHRRVNEAFRSLAAADPERWVVIDGAGPVEEVEEAVREAVRDRLGLG
jgi:dTMP kinase